MSAAEKVQGSEIQVQPEPKWWGVTIGSLVYAVRAPDEDTAENLAFEALGVPRAGNPVPTFVERHGEEHQGALTDKFGELQRAIRVRPFSMEPA